MNAPLSPTPARFPRTFSHLQRQLRRRSRQLVHPLLDRASARFRAEVPILEAALHRVEPTLSLHRILARVVAVRDETHDVTTFVLRPNARFGQFKAGSYVTVHVRVGTKTLQRAYSLSSAPEGSGLIAITVKRVPGGIVSNHLADEVVPGEVLELSEPRGQFTLPNALPPKLLMISAGSGITPVMSMVRHLTFSAAPVDVTFLHFARSPADVIFRHELDEIAGRVPRIRVVTCVEQGSRGGGWNGRVGRFSERLLCELVPDFRELDTYLCGPPGFMQTVLETFERASADLSKLRYERFAADFDASMFLESARVIRFLRSGVEALSNRPLTVLQEAEARNITVETGCRAGTCGTCRCRKRRGVVVNAVTGEESGAGEELIYPCVSIARGTVELDL